MGLHNLGSKKVGESGIVVGSIQFNRYPIKTHFVTVGQDYIELVKHYVSPQYREGDVLAISEKVISLCQDNVIYLKDLQVTWLARLLSRFASKNPAGPAMDNRYKMQAAINICGAFNVLLAAIVAGLTKVLGIKGTFYRLLGQEVAGIDGFCVVGFDYYADKGILSPRNPNKVCSEIKDKLGIDCMIVDANDLGVELLGSKIEKTYPNEELTAMIRDNPAGQGNQQTPFVLIRQAG